MKQKKAFRAKAFEKKKVSGKAPGVALALSTSL